MTVVERVDQAIEVLSDLRVVVGQVEDDRADLRAANLTLVSERDILRAESAALTAQIADLQAANARLLARIEELETPEVEPDPPTLWRSLYDSLRVRSGPGTQYPRVAWLQQGDVVTALEREGVWVRHATGWSAVEATDGRPLMEALTPVPVHSDDPRTGYIQEVGNPVVGAGPADPFHYQLGAAEYGAIAQAKMTGLLLLITGGADRLRPAQYDHVKAINPDITLVARTWAPFQLKANPVEYANYIRPGVIEFYEAGGRWCQIENETGSKGEGFGTFWPDGAAYATWWLAVRDTLAPDVPEMQWLFTPLSPNDNFWPFFNGAIEAVEAADGIAIHVYWNRPHVDGDEAPNSLTAAMQAVRDFANKFPHKPVMVTEFSRQAGDDMDVKGAEYALFVTEKYPANVVGLFGFVLGSSSGWESERWVGTKIPELIGQALERKDDDDV